MRLGQASFLVGGLLVATAPAAYAAGTTERVSVSSSGEQSDRDSYDPALSGNGRVVAFDSLATNLAGITDGQPSTSSSVIAPPASRHWRVPVSAARCPTALASIP
jgi:hypothetical protein